MKYSILLMILLVSVACQRKYICPAFQSSFILDKQKTEEFFSMFGNDSLPKSNLVVKKNKNGIIVRVKYRKRVKDIETVRMKTIFPPPTDSVLMAERNIGDIDSTSLDSLLNEGPQYEYKFNRDQLVYMHHIGGKLQMEAEQERLKKEEAWKKQQMEEEAKALEKQQEQGEKKKGWWPFGKKNKEDKENPDDQTDQENDEDEDEEGASPP